MADSLKRENVSDLIATKIKHYIIDHGLKSGDRLPTENELAKLFGVSRISVREATKALGFLGIIDAAPRRGLTIGKLDVERLSHFLGLHFELSDYPLDQLIESRAAIELGGLTRTVELAREDPTICDHLERINDRLRSIHSLERLDEWIDIDIEFHSELLRASGLEPLVAFHDFLLVFFRRVRSGMQVETWSIGIQAHQKIIDSIRRGDLVGAQDELSWHIEKHRSRV